MNPCDKKNTLVCTVKVDIFANDLEFVKLKLAK